jgi:hypothetical protein
MVGPIDVNSNFSYEYEVAVPIRICSEDFSKTKIHLSYNSGSLVNGVDFFAPKTATIGENETKIKFTISFKFDCDSEKIMKVAAVSESGLEMCFPFEIKIKCNNDGTDGEGGGGGGTGGTGGQCMDAVNFWEPYGHATKVPNNGF